MSRHLRSAWAIAALFAAAMALYWAGLRYPPVFDDGKLAEPFFHAYAAAPFRFDLRWLAYASFGWIYAVIGADLFWQRVANVLLHAAVASCLFLFLQRLFSLKTGQKIKAALTEDAQARSFLIRRLTIL